MLKGYRKLDALRTRRLPKVWLHVALSVLTMNGSALAKIQAGDLNGIRKCAPQAA